MRVGQAALPALVARHTFYVRERNLGCPYAEDVSRLAHAIIDASDDEILNVAKAAANAVRDIDYEDGWPTDKAGYTLVAVCLGIEYGIEEPLNDHSRWPAEASTHVWEYVVGSGNYNEVVLLRRRHGRGICTPSR